VQDALVPRPVSGRVYTAQRRIRLSDVDAGGRFRFDAIARYLQDVATDDVIATGRDLDERVWVVRRTRIDVVSAFRGDDSVELATWCSGAAAAAAARRTSVVGDAGGRVEAESIWIHVGSDGRPARLDSGFFDVYGGAAGGRRARTRLVLPDPPAEAPREPWPLRATDVDVLGHVNNAAYWHGVEAVVARTAVFEGPASAVLEFRRPVDLGDAVELSSLSADDGAGVAFAFVVGGDARAVGALRAL
jgi:acyl-ACP thioesterase